MGGTICVLKQLGYKVGICDLCAGEAGTYGSAEIRKRARANSEILQLDARITLDMPDGNIRNTEENRLKLIEVIRAHRPEIVFGFAHELSAASGSLLCRKTRQRVQFSGRTGEN